MQEDNVIRRLGVKGNILILTILLSFIFSFQNVEPVNVDFLFWDFAEVPKLYLMLFCFLLGNISGILIGFLVRKQRKTRNR